MLLQKNKLLRLIQRYLIFEVISNRIIKNNTQQQQVDELQKQSIQQKKLQPQENLSQ